MPGLFDRWRKKKKGDITRREDLAQIGLLVATGDELDSRIRKRKDFFKEVIEFREHVPGMLVEGKPVKKNGKLIPTQVPAKEKTPEQQIIDIMNRLDTIDQLIKEVAVPFGRGGTEDWYRTVMLGWEGLLSKSRKLIQAVATIMQKNAKVNKATLVRQLRGFLLVSAIKYAQWIEDSSYFEKDVTAKWNLVVQMPQQQYGGGGAPQPRAGSMAFPFMEQQGQQRTQQPEEDEKGAEE